MDAARFAFKDAEGLRAKTIVGAGFRHISCKHGGWSFSVFSSSSASAYNSALKANAGTNGSTGLRSNAKRKKAKNHTCVGFTHASNSSEKGTRLVHRRAAPELF